MVPNAFRLLTAGVVASLIAACGGGGSSRRRTGESVRCAAAGRDAQGLCAGILYGTSAGPVASGTTMNRRAPPQAPHGVAFFPGLNRYAFLDCRRARGPMCPRTPSHQPCATAAILRVFICSYNAIRLHRRTQRPKLFNAHNPKT